jgi:hypothetical protein
MPVPGVRMSPTSAVQQVVRVVAEGTGRTPAEVWVIFAGAVAATVTKGAVRGALRVLDYATDSDFYA